MLIMSRNANAAENMVAIGLFEMMNDHRWSSPHMFYLFVVIIFIFVNLYKSKRALRRRDDFSE